MTVKQIETILKMHQVDYILTSKDYYTADIYAIEEYFTAIGEYKTRKYKVTNWSKSKLLGWLGY